MKSRFILKCAAAGIAFVPGAILGLNAFGRIPDSGIVKLAWIFNMPAASVTNLARSLGASSQLALILFCAAALAWASFVALMFWKIASTLLGEEDPRGKFDWAAFRLRFVLGAILGCMLGWRFWVGNYGWASELACVGVGAVVVGLALGIAWRDDFWSRGY